MHARTNQPPPAELTAPLGRITVQLNTCLNEQINLAETVLLPLLDYLYINASSVSTIWFRANDDLLNHFEGPQSHSEYCAMCLTC